ncbi:MAG: HAD-IC family P-type ATPase [Bacilli bacterium]|nr:HAD-IC family P-type ATPase [Bacilli bacterium]MDY6430447.1 HAD-IC family P-type ATPase [Bacilli bacterium]
MSSFRKKSSKLDEQIKNAILYNPSPEEGLTSQQVEARTKEGLLNKSKKVVTKSYTQIFLTNVFNPLNIILFGVFALMLTAKLDIMSYFFMGILTINMFIGIAQDIHARRLVLKLKVLSDPKAEVIRDGKLKTIDAGLVVFEDIMLLHTGDQICADSVLIEGNCSVDESMLTGESDSISKVPGDTLYSGTFVTKGNVKVKVVKVSSANYSEIIRSKAGEFYTPKSEIKHTINIITLICGFTALLYGLLAGISFIVKGEFTEPAYVSFVKSTSGAMVAMIPAGMFLLTSCALAVGVIQLSRKRMLVQQLYCIEMLARVDVLCLDKTGTLTDGTMDVSEVSYFNKAKEEDIISIVSNILHFTGDSNATAAALRKKFGENSEKQVNGVLPFDSESKFSAISTTDNITYCLGAYGFVPADNDEDAEVAINNFSARGLRCIVVSENKGVIEEGKIKKKGCILAVIGLSDHIKDDAKDTIAWFKSNDVAIRVISGDAPQTVSYIAKEAGVENAENYISLQGMSLEEVALIAGSYTVFGRVSPEQKAVLISTFKKMGHTVAMTGDGVNDVLALKVADCSIAMASGSDAAKAVAHLVTLDNSFSSLPDVVAQGRRVINNLSRTCSLFLTKTIFAMTLSLIFLISVWCGGRAYPFKTTSLFVWETISIGIAAFFLALQPSNERLSTSFARKTFGRAIPAGICQVIGALVPFIFAIYAPEILALNVRNANLVWEVATTVSVIIFSELSFVILLRVCWPLDKYRTIVFFICLILGFGCFLLDYYKKKPLDLIWTNLNIWSVLVILIVMVVMSLVYLGLDKTYRYISDSIFKENVKDEAKNK